MLLMKSYCIVDERIKELEKLLKNGLLGAKSDFDSDKYI